MTPFPWDQAAVGWIHITCAAIVAGGFFFWYFALGAQDQAAPIRRYRPVFWTAALLLFCTGGFTWMVRMHEGRPHEYLHALYLKVLLFVVLFGIAGPLVKRASNGSLAAASRRWIGVCCLLCLCILFISSYLRRFPPKPNHPGTFPRQAAVSINGNNHR